MKSQFFSKFMLIKKKLPPLHNEVGLNDLATLTIGCKLAQKKVGSKDATDTFATLKVLRNSKTSAYFAHLLTVFLRPVQTPSMCYFCRIIFPVL